MTLPIFVSAAARPPETSAREIDIVYSVRGTLAEDLRITPGWRRGEPARLFEDHFEEEAFDLRLSGSSAYEARKGRIASP